MYANMNVASQRRELLMQMLAAEGVKFSPLRTITPRNSNGPAPLSFAQQRLWFLQQLDPESSAYGLSLAVRCDEPINVAALQQSFSEIVRRHEILRTTFTASAGQPVQVIAPAKPVELCLSDLSAIPVAEREPLLQRIVSEAAQCRFDLETGPLLRLHLVRVSARDHVVMFCIHHIIADGWSTKILVRELTELYAAFADGRPSPLAELSVQYADFAEWQRAWLQGDVLEQELSYWTERLGGGRAVLELPADHPRTSSLTDRGAIRTLTVAPDHSRALKELCEQHDVTMFMALLAAFQVLLYRYTGEHDIIVGSPIANRNRSEVEPLIGFFVNTLVLRSNLAGDPTFAELLDHVRKDTLGAYEHQDLPFEKLVDALQSERELSRTPLFQVCFVLQTGDMTVDAAPSQQRLSLTPVNADHATAKFDLTLVAEQQSDGLSCSLEFKTGLFEPATIERMLGHYERLLESIVSDPHQTVSELSILTTEERARILNQNRNNDLPVVQSTLAELFAARVVQRPDAVAVVFENQRVTYAELNVRANRLAQLLRQRGIGPESIVAICLERSVDLVISVLATIKAGAAYLPLDPDYPQDRISFMLADSSASVVITQSTLAGKLGVDDARTICLDRDAEPIAQQSESNPAVDASPHNLAYVIYTSGSTGRPKGVMVTQHNVLRLFASTQREFSFGPADRWTFFHSYAFDFSVWEMWGALLYGGQLLVVPYFVSRNPEEFYSLVAENRVTVLNQTPSAFRQFMRADEERPASLSLRVVIFGGEALEIATLRDWVARHGADDPQLINMYGITETTVHVTYRKLLAEEIARSGIGSVIGPPIADLQLYLLDDMQQLCGVNIRGEMYVGGEGLARGYLGRADLTAERFIPNPFATGPGQRLYRTGDEGKYCSNWDIEYTGRKDDQVKIRGFRIETGEIEVVLREHNDVGEAVVVARVDETGEKRLVGYLVLRSGSQLTVSELRALVQERLPEYMVPSAFVVLDELPLTSNGKLDRRALPAPGPARPSLAETHLTPRNEIEEVLVAIWSKVLGLEVVGVTDNFFDLGGDSIRSVQVVALAKERGLNVSLQQLFQYQTIAQLAGVITAASSSLQPVHSGPFALIGDEDRKKLPHSVEDAYPLTMLQAGMLFHLELMHDTLPYLNVNSIYLELRFDLEKFQEAVRLVVARHPVLRTSFDLAHYSEPLQLVHTTASLPIGVSDIRHLSGEEQQIVVDCFVAEEAKRPFDFEHPPQLRFHFHLVSNSGFYFTLTENHAIFDGWSLHATLNEIFNVYSALLNAQPLPQLAPLNSSFRDFVLLERAALESEECREFWARKLDDFTPLELPSGFVNNTERGIRRWDVPISQELSKAVKRLATFAAVPVKSVLLAAHLKVLSIISGQRDVITGLTMHGRPEQTDGEQVRGLFLNTVPLRRKLSTGSWLDLIRDTFAAEREIIPFRRYPLAQMQKEHGGCSLFETSFNFIHFHVVQDALQSDELQTGEFKKVEATNFKLVAGFALDLITAQLGLELNYDSAVLSEEQIAKISGYYLAALDSMVSDPLANSQFQSLLTFAEQQFLRDWTDTKSDYPSQAPIHWLFEEQVEQRPDAIALVYDETEITYAELNRRANQLARYLREVGIGPEMCVAVMMDRSIEMVVALLGVLKAGGAYLALDPVYPEARLNFMIEDAGVPVVLTERRYVGLLRSYSGLVVECDRWPMPADSENIQAQVTADNLAYVSYTSGSSGQPKGIQITHQAVARLVKDTNYAEFSPDSVFLQLAPISFDASTFEIWGALLNGAKLVIMPAGVPSIQELGTALQRYQVTTLWLTAGLFNLVVDEACECLQGVRQLLVGGEAVSVPHVKKALARLRNISLINGYGPTESTTFTCCYNVGSDFKNGSSLPIGRPIANTEVYIVDQDQQLLPQGVAGELCIGGAGLARGYLNRADRTAEMFVPHPYSDNGGGRLYRSGDLARLLPDGNIEFLGRIDRQVKIRGHRIELGEVEAALQEHPGVDDAAVVMREDQPGDKRLIAYFVAAAEATLTCSEVRQYLEAKLPEYMVPSATIALEQLPLTVNGKLDHRALPEPNAETAKSSDSFVGPRTAVEEILTAVWAQTLRVPTVGIHDDFFELGGHSLVATQVVSRIREAFTIDLPLRTLFDSATIASLAPAIEVAIRRDAASTLPPLTTTSRAAELPLSFAQQRLWFLDQLEPHNHVYNIPASIRLDGQLSISALEQSLSEIVSRHEILRTSFGSSERGPLQQIAPARSIKLPVIDLTTLRTVERDATVVRLTTEEARKCFDLSQAPLWRASLLRLHHDEHVLLFTVHHAICDGWSMGLLTKEISALYAAFVSGAPSPLPELKFQYADFSVWQREWLKDEALEAQLSYWRQQLADAPALLDLPTDHPRSAVQTHRGGRQTVHLNAELTQRLRELSRQEGTTLFMLLLAAFQVLMARYSGSEDVPVGTPIANRNHGQVEDLIGFFVNMLVMRTKLTGNPSFRELLKRVREVCLGAYAHQDMPFEMLVDRLGVNHNPSHTPLFQVVFVLQNAPSEELTFGGLRFRGVDGNDVSAKFDLTLELAENEQGLTGSLEYNADLFDPSTAERITNHFEQLLNAIVADAEQNIWTLPLVTAEGCKQLLEKGIGPAENYGDEYVIDIFDKQAEQTPDAIAVIYGDAQLSYGELNRRANQLAHRLHALGVGPEDRVGLLLDRSVETVISVLAVLKSGGAYIPLDTTYPGERLQYMIANASPHVVLTRQEFTHLVGDSRTEVCCLDAAANEVAACEVTNPESHVLPENLAYIIYTSGSTGRPKGVMISHRGLANYLRWARENYPTQPGLCVPVHSSLSFDLTVTSLFVPLLSGQTVLLLPESYGVEALADALKSDREFGLIKLTPAHLKLLEQELSGPKAYRSVSSLVVGGEALHQEDLRLWRGGQSATRIINEYGPTETVVGCCVHEVGDCEAAAGNVPIGKPILNTTLYVLDRQMVPAPEGVPGELYIGGAAVARGYFNDPALTAEKFIPDPFAREIDQRVYRSGDIVRFLASDQIEFLRRADDQVKVNGYRIELGEIEATLCRHPDVANAVVIAAKDKEGHTSLIAYVISNTGITLTKTELRTWTQTHLPDYMTPRQFVLLPQLSLTPSGKIDRRSLPEPTTADVQSDSVHVAPRNSTEEILEADWAKLLQLEKVGINDNFFELGGHSLLAAEAVMSIKEIFNVEISLRRFLESPTIAALAKAIEIEARPAGSMTPITSRARDENVLPVSFNQEGRLRFEDFAAQREERILPFVSSYCYRVNGPLNVALLERSLDEMVRRHEVFRTGFHVTNDEAVQIIGEEREVHIPVLDLEGFPDAEQEAMLFLEAESQRGFDRDGDCLLRMIVVRLKPTEHIVLLSVSHLVWDAWSLDPFLQEMAGLYRAYETGDSLPPAISNIQFADFAVWERQRLEQDFEPLLQFWKDRLEGIGPLPGLQLPGANALPEPLSLDGSSQSVRLPASVVEELRKCGRQNTATVFMMLLAGLKAVLCRYTDKNDLAILVPVANRTRSELKNVIGWISNVIVLRTEVSADLSFVDLLTRVRERALEAYAHQDMPYAVLVDKLKNENDRVPYISFNMPDGDPVDSADSRGDSLIPGLDIRPIALPSTQKKVGGGLAISVTRAEDGLCITVDYEVERYDADIIANFLDDFRTVLETMAANPQTKIADVSLAEDCVHAAA